MPTKEQVEAMCKELIERAASEGKIMELGWIAVRLSVIPYDAGAVQIEAMRFAFFAGAQHLFASILSMLDKGIEPTDEDLRRMDLIHKELADFANAAIQGKTN